MTEHDPRAAAWRRFRSLMRWSALAALGAVLLALVYLKASGQPMPIHMVIATIAGVGFTVLLGAALMGLVFLSNASGHDESASGKGGRDDS